MRLLAVETSGVRGGIALAHDGQVIDEVALGEGMRHGRDLLVAAQKACHRAGWEPRRLDAVAVSIGPGSFTGLRIAVVFAKVVAWDTGARIAAVPTLAALSDNAPPDAPRVACVLDAKRGGLYASIFEGAADDRAESFGPALIEPESLAARLKAPCLVLGRGVPKARRALADFSVAPEELWDVRPAAVARRGHAMLARGDAADPLRLEPLYIRRPEAEELWHRRQRGHHR